jgi:hypothetical protein
MSALIPRKSIDEMPPKLSAMLKPRVVRLGYLGEFFQYAANQPEALICFQEFTEALKKAIPERLTEVVALTVAALTDNAYERVQHERLSLKLGYAEEWIRNLQSMDECAQGILSETEYAVKRLVTAVIKNQGHSTRAELERVVCLVGQQETVAILMLIGRYVAHALMVNCLQLAPPVASPLELKSI